MKKGRSALKLSVLAFEEQLSVLSAFILEQTTSIGLRYYAVDRKILERRIFDWETPYGTVKVKEVISPSGAKRHKIEYESLRKLKELHDINILQLQKELYPLLNSINHEEE